MKKGLFVIIMSRVITDLPDKIDPVVLIEKKMLTCPLCGGKPKEIKWYQRLETRRDANGKQHLWLMFLNKYEWHRYSELICKQCGCKWDTGWYPADHKMFEIEVRDDKDALADSVNKMIEGLGLDLEINIECKHDDKYACY